jgi:hypothetical protein
MNPAPPVTMMTLSHFLGVAAEEEDDIMIFCVVVLEIPSGKVRVRGGGMGHCCGKLHRQTSTHCPLRDFE